MVRCFSFCKFNLISDVIVKIKMKSGKFVVVVIILINVMTRIVNTVVDSKDEIDFKKEDKQRKAHKLKRQNLHFIGDRVVVKEDAPDPIKMDEWLKESEEILIKDPSQSVEIEIETVLPLITNDYSPFAKEIEAEKVNIQKKCGSDKKCNTFEQLLKGIVGTVGGFFGESCGELAAKLLDVDVPDWGDEDRDKFTIQASYYSYAIVREKGTKYLVQDGYRYKLSGGRNHVVRKIFSSIWQAIINSKPFKAVCNFFANLDDWLTKKFKWWNTIKSVVKCAFGFINEMVFQPFLDIATAGVSKAFSVYGAVNDIMSGAKEIISCAKHKEGPVKLGFGIGKLLNGIKSLVIRRKFI
jgi:hypothetical protein